MATQASVVHPLLATKYIMHAPLNCYNPGENTVFHITFLYHVIINSMMSYLLLTVTNASSISFCDTVHEEDMCGWGASAYKINWNIIIITKELHRELHSTVYVKSLV